MRPGDGVASALAAVLTMAAPGAAASQEATAPPAPLLGYCAPPVVPSCLEELKGRADLLTGCARRADAYEATVFAYRLCLTRETERAVREANVAMAKLRCAQRRGSC